MKLLKETFYHDIGTENFTQKEHSHIDTYELLQVLSGEGEFVINSKSYHFREGAAFMIDAENFHYSAPQDPNSYIRNKLIIQKSMLLTVADMLGIYDQIKYMFADNNNSVHLDKTSTRAVDALFHTICEGKNPLVCANNLLELLNILWQNIHTPVVQDETLSIIFETVNNHIRDEFSLDILSKETNMDKYYLCHYFKSKTGMTIFDYLKCQRIEMAKKLLVENNTSISQIANACGYNSLAYFSKCFKEATGMTPKEYMKSVL